MFQWILTHVYEVWVHFKESKFVHIILLPFSVEVNSKREEFLIRERDTI